MLAKVKKALRITTDDFDSELLDLIESAIEDLKVVGAEFTWQRSSAPDIIIPDAQIRIAVITYCKMHFGQPDRYDQLKASYDEQKAQLRETRKYGQKQHIDAY